MKVPSATSILLGFVSSAYANTMLWAVLRNGVDQGDGRDVYIRSPPTDAPLKDLKSDSMRCGIDGDRPVPRSIEVEAGDLLNFEWHKNDRSKDDIIMDPDQEGAVQIYIAPFSSNGVGNVWIKLFSKGYSTTVNRWGTQLLVENRGLAGTWVPNLQPGKYLVRPEILALHEADELFSKNPDRGIRVYTGCVQIDVTSNGTLTLPEGIAFPGAYADDTPGILYSGDPRQYQAPGGDVFGEAENSLLIEGPKKGGTVIKIPMFYNFRPKKKGKGN